MATGHVHALYRHGSSAIHRLEPQTKIAAAFLFVFAVVATPREAMWAFGIYAAALVTLAAVAGLEVRFVATRLLVEVPFVIAALLFPIIGGGDRIDIVGISLSRNGLWDMWNVLAKATLGLLTSVILAGTTDIPSILKGFDSLRMPRALTAIMGFMIRYLDVVLGEFRRMRVAMAARAHNPQWIGHVKPYSTSAGTIFVRSYERGERVYLAMASRGYTGQMPRSTTVEASWRRWMLVLLVPASAWTVAITARITV